MGVCQARPGTKDCPLALEMKPVVSAEQAFNKWKHEQLVGTLGHATAPTTPQPASGATPEMQGMMMGFQALMDRMAANCAAVMQQPTKLSATAANAIVGATAEEQKGKQYCEFERAVLQGYSHVPNKEGLQLLWRKFQRSKIINTARGNIKAKDDAVAKGHRYRDG